jgi:UDP-N-acetylmuramate dehydrogenase
LISITEIKDFFKGKIALNEQLGQYTTFRIGGVADYYIEPADDEDLLQMIKYLNKRKIPYYILGNGSNILISDEGMRGVVINLEAGFSYLTCDDGYIIAGAGAKMARFVEFCIQNKYSGVEMLAGIPATIGGALVMNAGAYGGEIATYVAEVKVIRKEQIKFLSREQCGFEYRNSKIKDTIILQSKFILPEGNPMDIIRRRKEFLIKRKEAQPVDIPNAGCIFKNPSGNYAAKLIEDCGLKGTAIGGAMVSPKHANFIVNYDNANASDVIELIRLIRTKVRVTTGILLELEVKLVGFEEVLI